LQKKGLAEPLFIFRFDAVIPHISIFLLLGVAWLIPEHLPPWTSYHTEVPAFVSALVMLYVVIRIDKLPRQIPSAIWILVLLGASALAQWMFGLIVYLGDLLVVLAYLLAFAGAWFYSYQVAQITTHERWTFVEQVALFVLCIGLCVALQLLVQWLRVEVYFHGWILDGLPGGRARANVGQPNQAATTVLMGIVAVVVLYRSNKLAAWLGWLAVFLLTWAMVLTQSRTALVASAVLSVLAFVVRVPNSNPNGNTLFIGRAQIMVWGALILGMTWGFHSIKWSEAAGGAGLLQLAQPGTRMLIWAQIFRGLIESPWFGYGWLQVATAQQVGALHIPGAEQASYAHNIVVDLFAMLGVPAGLLVVVLVVYWGAKRIRLILRSKEAVSGVFLLIPLLIHANLEYPHAYAYFVVLAGLMFGVVDVSSRSARTQFSIASKRSLTCILLVVTGGMLWMGYEYALVEEDFRVNRFENRRIGTTPEDYRPPTLYALTQMDAILKGMRLRASREMRSDDLDLLVSISRRYSWAQLHFRTALALALNGRYRESEHQLKVIKGLFAEDIYQEAKDNLLRMQKDQYPEIQNVRLP
jgi:hypothetical protein